MQAPGDGVTLLCSAPSGLLSWSPAGEMALKPLSHLSSVLVLACH